MTAYITKVEFNWGGMMSEVSVTYHLMNGCVIKEKASGPHHLMVQIADIMCEAMSVKAGYDGPSIYEIASGRARPMGTATVVEDQPALPGAPLMIEDKR